jgi:hypothetical protein
MYTQVDAARPNTVHSIEQQRYGTAVVLDAAPSSGLGAPTAQKTTCSHVSHIKHTQLMLLFLSPYGHVSPSNGRASHLSVLLLAGCLCLA